LLIVTGCQSKGPDSSLALLQALAKGCAIRDAGLVMDHVDIHYQDDLGGPGRLEDDLRQLFRVYGKLQLQSSDVSASEDEIKGHAVVEGKGLRFEGPMKMVVARQPAGKVLVSGVLTDMRGIIYSLRERRLALETGAVDRLQRLVSPDYRGKVGGRSELIERLRRDLKEVSAHALMIDHVDILVSDGEARVDQSFLLITSVAGRKLENRDKERLRLKKDGHWWYFTGGLG
jgi:hypothetical protein